jgi:hypothetical protein
MAPIYMMVAILVLLISLGRAGSGISFLGIQVAAALLVLPLVATPFFVMTHSGITSMPRRHAHFFLALVLALMLSIAGLLRPASTLSLVALRDATYTFYPMWALLSYAIVARLCQEGKQRSLRLMHRAIFSATLFVLIVAFVSPLQAPLTALLSNYSDAPGRIVKYGDLGVAATSLLALAIARLVAGPAAISSRQLQLSGVVFGISSLTVLAFNRGGFLAMLLGTVTILIWERRRFLPYLVRAVVILSLTTPLMLWVSSVSPVEISHRSLSAEQLETSISSLMTLGNEVDRDGTTSWRLAWWTEIFQEAKSSPSALILGQGFGSNLAGTAAFAGSVDDLRSPHNFALTLLARQGLVGLLAAGLVALTLLRCLVPRSQRPLQRSGQLLVSAVAVAAVVNSIFDVYLEGVQGPVVVWSLIGFGLALGRPDFRSPHPDLCERKGGTTLLGEPLRNMATLSRP